MNRAHMLQQLDSQDEWDLCIIGGGATGLGTALDAAHRGLKTLLLEKYDFAKGTSSRSTKLVHGGVRYLQQGNIKLVMEALRERGLLIQNAPHLVHNQTFIVPNYQWWEKPFYGIGLKIYDKMAGKLGLGASEILSREETIAYLPTLDPKGLKGGVRYHDGQFDDARLAISIAQTAVQQGATLLNYFWVNGLLKQQNNVVGVWAKDSLSGKEYSIKSKVVINATGVFTDHILKMDTPGHQNIISPSQGIHLVVDKDFLPGQTAIMVPRTDDGRVLFAVPWHDKIVLGTTDTAITNIVEEPVPLPEEINFVLQHIGRYLTRDPQLKDVKSMFAGLRPLVKGTAKSTAALSRDHFISINESGLVTVTGGKWTTYRKMAEDVLQLVAKHFPVTMKKVSTQTLKLQGHDQPVAPFAISTQTDDELRKQLQQAVASEMCMTVEDFLARRTRQLLLDAQVAIDKAPFVAQCMAKELGHPDNWITEQIDIFKKLAANYLPATAKN